MKRLVLAFATLSVAVTACSGGNDSESSTATARAHPTTTGPAFAFTEVVPPPPLSPEDASAPPVVAQFTATDVEGIAIRAGFTTSASSIDRRMTLAAALITLPDRPEGLFDAEVTFTLLDEAGAVVDSEVETVSFIPPGATVPVAPQVIGYALPEDPAAIEVAVSGRWGAAQDWNGTELPTEAALGQGRRGASVIGEMRNDGDVATSEEIVWHCAFLQSGDIVGGARSQIVIPVPPGGTQEFDAQLSVDVEADEVTCRSST